MTTGYICAGTNGSKLEYSMVSFVGQIEERFVCVLMLVNYFAGHIELQVN